MSSKLEMIQNRWIELKGVVLVPTVKVKHIRTGRAMIIALKNYNKHIHELQEELPELQKEQEFDDNGDPIEDNFEQSAAVSNANMSSRITKEEMLVMSIDALYLLPEWQHASARQRTKCANKTDVIELIIAIRKQ